MKKKILNKSHTRLKKKSKILNFALISSDRLNFPAILVSPTFFFFHSTKNILILSIGPRQNWWLGSVTGKSLNVKEHEFGLQFT